MTSTDITRRPATDGGGSPVRRWEDWWRDVPPWLLPVLLAAIQVGGGALADLPLGTVLPIAGPRLPELLGFTLLVVGPLALLWRHGHPLLSLTVALAATYGYLILGYPRGPFFLAAFVALAVAANRARRAAVWAITALFFLPVAGTVYLTGIFSGAYDVGSRMYVGDIPILGTSPTDAAFTVAWTAIALVIGEAVRAQRERYAASDQARAEADRARVEADRARSEQSRRVASDERLRSPRNCTT